MNNVNGVVRIGEDAMEKDISLSIVQGIAKDIHTRYATKRGFDWIHPAMQLKVLETWRHLVSKELYMAGAVPESINP